jgi:hypothetical protein
MEPMQPTQPQRSWWSRNWKWVVPVGCLVLILPLLAFTGFIAGLTALIFGSIKSTDVCQQAIALAKSNPAVIEALGQPVEDRWWVTGNIKTVGPSGSADVALPLRGPKGKGTLYAVATKSAGRWTYDTLEVEIEGRSERINLLEAEAGRGGS